MYINKGHVRNNTCFVLNGKKSKLYITKFFIRDIYELKKTNSTNQSMYWQKPSSISLTKLGNSELPKKSFTATKTINKDKIYTCIEPTEIAVSLFPDVDSALLLLPSYHSYHHRHHHHYHYCRNLHTK